jgi:hypothetical protein
MRKHADVGQTTTQQQVPGKFPDNNVDSYNFKFNPSHLINCSPMNAETYAKVEEQARIGLVIRDDARSISGHSLKGKYVAIYVPDMDNIDMPAFWQVYDAMVKKMDIPLQ